MNSTRLGILVAVILGFAGLGLHAAESDKPQTSDKDIAKAQRAAYPLNTCVVMGDKLSDKPVEVVVEGRLFRLCCSGCIKKVKADPAKYIALLDEAAKKNESKTKN
jgi:hypothetical protein